VLLLLLEQLLLILLLLAVGVVVAVLGKVLQLVAEVAVLEQLFPLLKFLLLLG
jgi:hypothetical protein